MLSKHCINSVVCSLLQTLCCLPQEEGTNCLLYFLLFTFCQIVANKPFGYCTRIVIAISCIDIFQRNFPAPAPFITPAPPTPPTLKYFLFKKRKLLFRNLMWAFLFLILRQCGKNHIPFTRADFRTSQYVSDDPKENFAVYALSLHSKKLFITNLIKLTVTYSDSNWLIWIHLFYLNKFCVSM